MRRVSALSTAEEPVFGGVRTTGGLGTDMDSSQLIASLNAINIGDLDVIRAKLEQAREACRAIDQPELADKLQEAVEALDQADLKTYRRRVETVVSKLGHIR